MECLPPEDTKGIERKVVVPIEILNENYDSMKNENFFKGLERT